MSLSEERISMRHRFCGLIVAGALCLPVAPVRADGSFLHASPSIVLAQPCAASDSCAFSWTLASRLGHILKFTQDRYGPRDRNWTLLGVEFTSGENPQVWYPSFGAGFFNVVVQLTQSSATDEKRALFQLSHEVVHLLSPAGPGARASVLEEGLATYNSLEYLNANGIPTGRDYINAPRYEKAFLAVERLAERPDFASGIRDLRARQNTLAAITADDLRRVYPGLSPSLAEELAARF